MRWIEPDKKDWMPVFDEGTGKERVTIEKGEYNYYRLKYWRGDTEAVIHVQAETVDDMAGILINEGMFTEEEARVVAQRIVY